MTRASESSTPSESIDCTWQPGTHVTTTYEYTWTDDEGYTLSTDGSMDHSGHVNAYAVYIQWQSTDFTTPPTTPTSNTDTATPDATRSTEAPSDSPSSSGLSTGAKAGIGVGVSAGVILLAALVFFLLWQRKDRQKQDLQSYDNAGAMGLVYQPPSEMPAESESAKRAVELPAGREMHELEGRESEG